MLAAGDTLEARHILKTTGDILHLIEPAGENPVDLRQVITGPAAGIGQAHGIVDILRIDDAPAMKIDQPTLLMDEIKMLDGRHAPLDANIHTVGSDLGID